MTKEEVKKRLEAGTIQIENDAPDRLELLREIMPWAVGASKYYNNTIGVEIAFKNLPIIKLSEIEEDVIWQYFNGTDWYDVKGQCRIKPQPDYTNEIEALQNKAK